MIHKKYQQSSHSPATFRTSKTFPASLRFDGPPEWLLSPSASGPIGPPQWTFAEDTLQWWWNSSPHQNRWRLEEPHGVVNPWDSWGWKQQSFYGCISLYLLWPTALENKDHSQTGPGPLLIPTNWSLESFPPPLGAANLKKWLIS